MLPAKSSLAKCSCICLGETVGCVQHVKCPAARCLQPLHSPSAAGSHGPPAGVPSTAPCTCCWPRLAPADRQRENRAMAGVGPRWSRRRSDGDLLAGPGSAGVSRLVEGSPRTEAWQVQVANCDSTVSWDEAELAPTPQHQVTCLETRCLLPSTSSVSSLSGVTCVEPDSTTTSTSAEADSALVVDGCTGNGVVSASSGGGSDSGCCSLATDSPLSNECTLDSPVTTVPSPAAFPQSPATPDTVDPLSTLIEKSDRLVQQRISTTEEKLRFPAADTIRFPNNTTKTTTTITTALSSCSSSAPQRSVERPGVVECRWQDCGRQLSSSSDLVRHLTEDHVRTEREQRPSRGLRCLWHGCKVFGQSGSAAWLQRHAPSHGGRRPFSCIVANCSQRFSTQLLLQRHVNSHFNISSPVKRGSESAPTAKSRKSRRLLHNEHPYSARIFDFFDANVMEMLHFRVVRSETLLDQLPPLSGHCLQLTAQVLARRYSDRNGQELLVSWHPPNIVDDKWVRQGQFKSTMMLPWRHLPDSELQCLHESIGDSTGGQRRRTRKAKRCRVDG